MSEMTKRKGHLIKHWHGINIFLIIYDALAIYASYFGALWIRFDCQYSAIPDNYFGMYLHYISLQVVLSLLIFSGLKLYRSIWRFASYTELVRVTIATLLTTLVHILGMSLTFGRMPISYYLFGGVTQFVLITAVRFSYRFILLERGRRHAGMTEGARKKVMLIGAGNAGQMILRDIKMAKQTYEKVCCIIDDNPNKWDRYVDGIPIVGGRDQIFSAVEKYEIERIYLALPSAKAEAKRDILNICKETGCELMSLPAIYQFRNGEVTVSSMKKVAVEDLLGREPIQVNLDEIYASLVDKIILVTGGGGSIGSELCRQIASHHPKQLIIFDVYENNAYDIQQELKKNYPDLHLEVLIGSVRDSARVNQVFETYRPDIVYHAAAHKHVPLMETSPNEAIKNNVIGTYKCAYAALRNGCSRFVLISTDKAVNPTNIMGASKRMCEMVIQAFDRMVKDGRAKELTALGIHGKKEEAEGTVLEAKTEFVAVRFGNVLGSNGSVLPLFKKQIEEGGPVTVTHPDIIRYFMTIPEAVSLVLQAGAYAKGGEIFVLDMGDPVKIDDLARNLIKLSGHKPDEDIAIVYTGLRPGEKLYEEKLMAEEGLKKTDNDLILIGCPLAFDTGLFFEQLEELMTAAYENRDDIIERVEQIVTTFRSNQG